MFLLVGQWCGNGHFISIGFHPQIFPFQLFHPLLPILTVYSVTFYFRWFWKIDVWQTFTFFFEKKTKQKEQQQQLQNVNTPIGICYILEGLPLFFSCLGNKIPFSSLQNNNNHCTFYFPTKLLLENGIGVCSTERMQIQMSFHSSSGRIPKKNCGDGIFPFFGGWKNIFLLHFFLIQINTRQLLQQQIYFFNKT